ILEPGASRGRGWSWLPPGRRIDPVGPLRPAPITGFLRPHLTQMGALEQEIEATRDVGAIRQSGPLMTVNIAGRKTVLKVVLSDVGKDRLRGDVVDMFLH